MDPEKPKRPRRAQVEAEPAMTDPSVFTENKCSQHAKMVDIHGNSSELEIWFDKHYYDRVQHGDENGARDGIGNDIVLKLVQDGFKHLLHYSVQLKDFRFVHYEEHDMAGRVVLQQCDDAHDEMLNVVVQYHFIAINRYEATVITAMRTDGFNIADGRYALQVIDKHSSELYRKQVKTLVKVSSYYK